ncbi:MAG: ExbD/TolR family protein [Bdellovibrionota bacterium]
MAANLGGDDDVISGINVTPLVDVVLVLLIIFMITAPVLYQSAIKVQLPKAKSGDEAQKSPLNFTITKDSKLNLDKEEIPWETLGARLAALKEKTGQETAIISADEMTPHGQVIKLMDALRQAGITRFALNVEAPAVGRR